MAGCRLCFYAINIKKKTSDTLSGVKFKPPDDKKKEIK